MQGRGADSLPAVAHAPCRLPSRAAHLAVGGQVVDVSHKVHHKGGHRVACHLLQGGGRGAAWRSRCREGRQRSEQHKVLSAQPCAGRRARQCMPGRSPTANRPGSGWRACRPAMHWPSTQKPRGPQLAVPGNRGRRAHLWRAALLDDALVEDHHLIGDVLPKGQRVWGEGASRRSMAGTAWHGTAAITSVTAQARQAQVQLKLGASSGGAPSAQPGRLPRPAPGPTSLVAALQCSASCTQCHIHASPTPPPGRE